MAINFPNSPIDGEIFVSGTTSFRYDATQDAWRKLPASNVIISDAAPSSNLLPGFLWFDSDTGRLSVYYDDGDSQQWVNIAPSVANGVFVNDSSFVYYDGALNVGIGTNTPSANLEVVGDIVSTGATFNGPTYVNESFFNVQSTTSRNIWFRNETGSAEALLQHNDNVSKLVMFYYNTDGSNEREIAYFEDDNDQLNFGTSVVTRFKGDARYPQLSTANTFAAVNTFSLGLTVAPNQWISTDKITERNGQGIVIAAGESDAQVDANLDFSASEEVFVVAENGLRIISSSDNWVTGWAGRREAFINRSSNGDSELPGNLYLVGRELHFVPADTLASGDDYIHWVTGSGLRGYENGSWLWQLGSDIQSFRDVVADRYVAAEGGYLFFTSIDAASRDYIRWVTANGLYGYENDVEVFRIGGDQFRCTAMISLTTANAANMWVSSGSGDIRRSTSVAEVKRNYERLDSKKVKAGEASKNIDPVDLIKRLNPLSFESILEADKKPDGTPGRFTGFVVEEIAEVYPEAISDEGNNYDTRAILALAVAAIGQLAERIEQLEQELIQKPK